MFRSFINKSELRSFGLGHAKQTNNDLRRISSDANVTCNVSKLLLLEPI